MRVLQDLLNAPRGQYPRTVNHRTLDDERTEGISAQEARTARHVHLVQCVLLVQLHKQHTSSLRPSGRCSVDFCDRNRRRGMPLMGTFGGSSADGRQLQLTLGNLSA